MHNDQLILYKRPWFPLFCNDINKNQYGFQFIFACFHLDQLPATFTHYLHGRQGHQSWFCGFATSSRGQSADQTEVRSSSAAIIINRFSIINEFYFSHRSSIYIYLQFGLTNIGDGACVKSAFRVWFLLSVQIQYTCVPYSDFYILINGKKDGYTVKFRKIVI